MNKILFFIYNTLAGLLPTAYSYPGRLLAAKLLLIGLLAGYLLSFPANYLLKASFKKIKEWAKEKRRTMRLISHKVPGTIFLGEVTQFLSKIKVAVVDIKNKDLKLGDFIFIKGKTNQYSFQVNSMQINKQNVQIVKKGQDAGLLVPKEVQAGDLVYKIKKKPVQV